MNLRSGIHFLANLVFERKGNTEKRLGAERPGEEELSTANALLWSRGAVYLGLNQQKAEEKRGIQLNREGCSGQAQLDPHVRLQ